MSRHIEFAQAVVFLAALVTATVTLIVGVDSPQWLLATIGAITAGTVLYVWLGTLQRDGD